MTRSRTIQMAIAVAAVATATTGCGRLIEKATEEAVEQAIESDSGKEVEIDFRDGEISVESDEGDVSFSADEGGGLAVEGSDGEAVFASSQGFPEQWPSDVPMPAALNDVTGTYFAEGDDINIVITGAASGDPGDVFDTYTGQLADAGFEEESTFRQGDEAASSSYRRGERAVTVTIQSLGGGSEMVVALR